MSEARFCGRLSALSAVFVCLTSCGPSGDNHPAGATPYTTEEKARIARGAAAISSESSESRADHIVACGLALLEADRKGLVGADAQFLSPWTLTTSQVGEAERLRCDATDSKGRLFVVVDYKCSDVNDASCHQLVTIER